MKRKTSFAFAFGSAAVLSLAFAAPAEAGRIGNRQERQQQRIAGGVSSGSLTARETARLERRETGLNRSVARMRSDGLTRGERARIEKRQDRISRGIYHQKHDGQTR
jgi:DNA-binding CsgD family transcriptional regulator